MITYTYKCSNQQCQQHNVEFETQQSILDDPLVECVVCGVKSLVKVIQTSGIVFKGSGFYVNDRSK